MAGILGGACSGPPSSLGEPGTPLFGSLAPDVLVESEVLSLPPELGGNRFSAGWVPWQVDDRLTLVGQPGRPGRLEIVHLGDERGAPRTLALDLEPPAPGDRSEVEVRVAGRSLGIFAVADPLEVPLPEDLGPGRTTVDLEWRGDPLVVEGAVVRPALPPGEVRLEQGALEQSGFSLVSLARPLQGASHLAGLFEPPRRPAPEQSFELQVVGEDGTGEAFRWPGAGRRQRGEVRFRLPLPRAGSTFGVRLLARGEGPAAAWRGLRLVGAQLGSRARQVAVPRRRLVLLYVFDALRADAVGHLGAGDRASPTLDRMAREGATFSNHGAVAPNTLPSTKALLTGRTWVERGGWKLPPEAPPTVAEHFRQAGFRTALVSANGYVGPAFGTSRGFDFVAEVVLDEAEPPINSSAEQVHAAALAWLEGLGEDESAFLYVHSLNPHNPYAPPAPWAERARTPGSEIDGSTATLLDLKQQRRQASASDRQRLGRLYAAGVDYNDAELGRFLEALEARFGAEELFVLVTSDHGEELFDHGGVLHGYTLYTEQLAVPLVVWAPGLVPPMEPSLLTDTLDLHATLVALAGGSGGSDGRSLLPLLSGSSAAGPGRVRFAAASSLDGPLVSVRSERWKVVFAPRSGASWGMGQALGRSHDPEYVFDLASDPGELENLAGIPSLEVEYLRSRLAAWLREGLEAPEEAVVEPIDPEARRRLRALGYLE